jgi:hypothetical protein
MGSTSIDWQETHVNGGDLIEIGTGASGLQPTKSVGTWDVRGRDICYEYDGDAGGPYCYSVYGSIPVASGAYEFCDGRGTAGLKAIGTID